MEPRHFPCSRVHSSNGSNGGNSSWSTRWSQLWARPLAVLGMAASSLSLAVVLAFVPAFQASAAEIVGLEVTNLTSGSYGNASGAEPDRVGLTHQYFDYPSGRSKPPALAGQL